jgi:hypothetical protein
MYISARGGGGTMAPNVGDHGFGGPAAFPFTKQVNSDIENGRFKDDAPPAQLYDLSKDPYQKINLYNDYPDVVVRMKASLAELMEASRTAPFTQTQK